MHFCARALDGGLRLGTDRVGPLAGLLGRLHDLSPSGPVVLVRLAMHPLDVLGRALAHEPGSLLGLAQPTLGALVRLGLANPSLLEQPFRLARRRLAGARGVRLRLGQHGCRLLPHPGRLRLGLGEAIAAPGRRTPEEGLRAVAGRPSPLGELLVVRPGAGTGIRLGLLEDLAHGALRPCQVGLRARDKLLRLGLGGPEDAGRVLACPPQEVVGLGSGPVLTPLDVREAGRDVVGGLRAPEVGELLALATQPLEVGDGLRPQGRQLDGVRLVLAGPPLLVRPLLVGQAGHRALVLEPCVLQQLVGPHPGVGQLGLRLLGGDADRLVARLRRPGPQQRRLVGGVGEHDLHLGPRLLEPAVGLLAQRADAWPGPARARRAPPASRCAPGSPPSAPRRPPGWRPRAAGRQGPARGSGGTAPRRRGSRGPCRPRLPSSPRASTRLARAP